LISRSRIKRLRALQMTIAMNAVADVDNEIIGRLSDDDQGVRIEAAKALAMSSSQQAKRALRDALMERSKRRPRRRSTRWLTRRRSLFSESDPDLAIQRNGPRVSKPITRNGQFAFVRGLQWPRGVCCICHLLHSALAKTVLRRLVLRNLRPTQTRKAPHKTSSSARRRKRFLSPGIAVPNTGCLGPPIHAQRTGRRLRQTQGQAVHRRHRAVVASQLD